MRKFVLAAAMAGATLTLGACSQGADDAAEATAEEATADAGAVAGPVVLDANAALAEQLTSVQGVTPELAEAIVAGRPYASVVDFNAKLLETLSAEQAAAVLVEVFVAVNLNTASKAELKLIPGMTGKMEHEFEEYRPYEDMAQFDREIGKYVDEAEVARFRAYVTL